MRNLKRALSLTLASVMLLGMMVVGAGAAGFPDVDDDNDNIEAIEVLKAVEVMIGDDNGNFGPNDPVNRSQMAVVMAKLLNLDYQYYEASCPFWDVPTWARPYVGACYANKIVSGYGDGTYGAADTVTAVQAASMMMRALGYFKYSEDYKDGFETSTVRQGTEIGIFDGVGSSATAPMTRAQVAQMALNALESEMVNFTGTPGTTYTTSTGESLSIGYVPKYEPRTSTEIKYQAIEDRTSDVAGNDNVNRGQYYIQLGEELYNGKLTKRFDRDDFMRPSINWQYDGKNIGTYVDYDLLVTGGTYTDEVKYSELYDLLTYTTIRDNDLDRYVDGVVVSNETKDNFSRSNDKKVGGRGVLTEVFFDQFRDEITITSINTYLAKANSDYNKNNETLSLKVYDKDKNGVTYTVDVDDVPEVVDAEKDDFMLVYLSGKDNAARMEVVNIFEVEILSDSTVTKFTKAGSDSKKVVDKLTTGGTEYKTNPKAFYNKGTDVLDEYDQQLLTDTSYNIFLDRYSNVIGVDIYEGTKNYVFIAGFDRGDSHISVKTADAAAIFLDGTMDVITVNVTDTDKNIDRMNGKTNDKGESGDPYFVQWSKAITEGRKDENRWYTYTVNSSGVYTLKPVANMFASDYEGGKVLNTANLYLDDNGVNDWTVDGWKAENAEKRISYGYTNKGRAYGEDASIYITVEPGHVDYSDGAVNDAITEVQGVYTGIQDIKMELDTPTAIDDQIPNRVYTVYDDDHYIIASIVVGEAQGATGNYAYVLSDVKSERYEAASSSRASKDDGVYYWEFEAYYQGEKTTLTARTKFPSKDYDLHKYTIQELRFDGDYVTDVKDVPVKDTHTSNITNNKIEDMDIYDVGRVIGTKWDDVPGWNDNHAYIHNTNDEPSNTASPNTGDRLYGTIYLQGRTLYVGDKCSDVGLALARDAKALLVQSENWDGVETREYSSVDEAVSNIADFDDIASGIQFRGRIAAVLDGRGAAEWVVIISDNELLTGNKPSYGNSDILRWTKDGQYWELFIPYGEYQDWTANSTTTIYNWLVKAGCSNVSKTREGWDFTYKNVLYYDQDVRVHWVYDDVVTGVSVTGDVPASVVEGTTSLPGFRVTVRFDDGETSTSTYTADVVATTVGAGKGTVSIAMSYKTSDKITFSGDLDGTTVNGWKLAVSDSNRTLTLSRAIDVTAKPVEGEVTVSVTKGRANILVDGKKVETVKKGQTISLDPAAALKVEAGTGITDNGDGTYTINADSITIVPKDSTYTWNNFFSQWFQLVDGKQVLVAPEFEWTVPETGASVASLSRFSLARAAEAETDPDRKPIDTTNPNWFFAYIKDPTKTFEIDVTITAKDGTTKTITFTGKVENAALVLAPAEGTDADDANKAWNEMGTEGSNTGAFEGGSGTVTPPATEKVWAKPDFTAKTATFEKYVPGGAAITKDLTAEEIAAALTEATEGRTFEVSGIDLDKKTATDTTGNIKLDIVPRPAQVFKITYPGGETYASGSNTKKITNLNYDVTALILADKVAGKAPDAVNVTTSGELAIGALKVVGRKDTEYKAAVALARGAIGNLHDDGYVTDAEGTKRLDASVVPGTANVSEALAVGTYTHVQAGKTIYFAQPTGTTLATGESIELEINGKVVKTFTAGTDGKFAAWAYTVPNEVIVDEATGVVTGMTMKATLKAVSSDADVYLDTNTKLDKVTENKITYAIIPMNGKFIATKDTNGVYTKVGTAVESSTGNAKVPLTDLSAGLDAAKNRIDVYSVYEVAYGDGTVWKAYTKHTAGGDSSSTLAAATSYVAPGDKIYVEAADNGTILAEAKGATELSGAIKSTKSVSGKAVWAYTVNKNLTAASFDEIITVAAGGSATITKSVAAGTASAAYDITGGITLTAANKPTVNVESVIFVPVANSVMDNNSFKFEFLKKADGGPVQLKVTPTKALTLNNTTGKAGTLSVTVNGIALDIDINVGAESPAEELARVAAAIEKKFERPLAGKPAGFGAAQADREAAVEAEVKSRVTGAPTIPSLTLDETFDSDGYKVTEQTAVENGTATAVPVPGVYTLQVKLKASTDATVTRTVTVTVNVLALAYEDTTAGQTEANAKRVTDAKAKIEAALATMNVTTSSTDDNEAIVAKIVADLKKIIADENVTVEVTATADAGATSATAVAITLTCGDASNADLTGKTIALTPVKPDATQVSDAKTALASLEGKDIAKAETEKTLADVKGVIEPLVRAALGKTNVTIDTSVSGAQTVEDVEYTFTNGIAWKETKAVKNGTKLSGTSAETAGEAGAYTMVVALVKGEAKDFAPIAVTVAAMPYAETAAGKADTAIKAVKDALEVALGQIGKSGTTDSAIISAVNSAITTALQANSDDTQNVSASVTTPLTKNTAEDGTLSVTGKITISCTNGTTVVCDVNITYTE